MFIPSQRLVTLTIFSFMLVPFFLLATTVHAQSAVKGAATLGVANVVKVRDKNVKNGSIISNGKGGGGNVPSTIPYDAQVVGVVSRDAGIIINNSNSDGVPVVSDGSVYVLVSGKNGPIKQGDLIATSSIPGVGVKATNDGYVLGSALEDDNNSNPNQVDLIAIEINLHYFNSKPTFLGSLSDIFKFALLPTKDGPTPLFKYVVAAIVVIASFVLAFMTFGRTAAKGVEALGRNPAASRIIHLGIIFNVGIVIIIVFAGLVVSFLILRL